MSLVPSLLQAIVNVDGDALVMHAGDKPYVVSPTGQVDLASRGLTLEAVDGILAQLLPIELQKALEEFGAVQHELAPMAEFPGEHFTVVAARGGDDLWTEIRRHRVPEDDRVPDEFFAPSPVHVAAPASAVSSTSVPHPMDADLALPVPDNDELPVEILGFDTPAIDAVRAAPLSMVAAADEPEAAQTADADLLLPDEGLLWPGQASTELARETIAAETPDEAFEIDVDADDVESEPDPQPVPMQPAAQVRTPPAPPAPVPIVAAAPPAPPPQAPPIAATIEPLRQVPPIAASIEPPPEAPPIAATVEPSREVPPVAATVEPPPQAPPIAATIEPPHQAPPIAATVEPSREVPSVAATVEPPQAPPIAATVAPPRQVPPIAASVERPPLEVLVQPRIVPPPAPAVVLNIARNPIRTELPPPMVDDPTLSGLERLLRVSSARGASTLYLSSQSRPSVRVDGELQMLDGEPVHVARDVESLLLTLMPERSHEALRTGAATEWICDLEGVGRVRCMSFRDQRGPGGVFRLMPTRSVSAEQLGCRSRCRRSPSSRRGLCSSPARVPAASGRRCRRSST